MVGASIITPENGGDEVPLIPLIDTRPAIFCADSLQFLRRSAETYRPRANFSQCVRSTGQHLSAVSFVVPSASFVLKLRADCNCRVAEELQVWRPGFVPSATLPSEPGPPLRNSQIQSPLGARDAYEEC